MLEKEKELDEEVRNLLNLKFQINQDSLSTDFIYVTYDRLID